MHFTGIGSRSTPTDVLQTMVELSERLCDSGMILRSGGADGADAAFERGCNNVNGKKEIYLPWPNFNDHPSDLNTTDTLAFHVAEQIYGEDRWKNIKPSVQKLMTRNVYQVVGFDIPNSVYSKFVLCYTEDGCESDKSRTIKTGGTGQAISFASILDIPVFNLRNSDAIDRLNNEIELIKLFGN